MESPLEKRLLLVKPGTMLERVLPPIPVQGRNGIGGRQFLFTAVTACAFGLG
jgi:hypothetical protein